MFGIVVFWELFNYNTLANSQKPKNPKMKTASESPKTKDPKIQKPKGLECARGAPGPVAMQIPKVWIFGFLDLWVLGVFGSLGPLGFWIFGFLGSVSLGLSGILVYTYTAG